MAADGFARVPAGHFTMGADDAPHPEDGEGPKRPVCLDSYLIARHAVTNADFAAFVAATGYVSTAERAGFSLVFQGQLAVPESHPVADPATPWWRKVDGTSWRDPCLNGPADPALPVVHLSHEDAEAYAAWAGGRLPTEAEWERAASEQPQPPHIFAGHFPDQPNGPVGPRAADNGPANGFGLVHPLGNVWEWVADRFTRLHGPREQKNPAGPLNGARFVVKGGSFLCCPSYCARFRPSSRRGELPQFTASHTGFRIARDDRR